MRPVIIRVLPCVKAVMVFDLHEKLASLNLSATCIKCIHACHREYARLEVFIDDGPLKFVCLRRGICNPRRSDNV